MTYEQRAQWVHALREGGYPQAQGYLFNGEAYCCLGVYAAAVLHQTFEEEKLEGKWVCPAKVENDEYLKNEVFPRSAQRIYAEMNDEGVPFDKIADRIEQDEALISD